MKFNVTHPKIWEKVSERNIPMKHKLDIYEKMGGAYRLGEDKGEQVFNKLTELIKYKAQNESEDHEVSMAQGSLEAIIKHAQELLKKIGNEEKDLPGWIQDHISKAENYIQQADDQYHEYGKNESINEADNEGYVVYIMHGIGKKKVKETAGKTNAIRLVNRLMTNTNIDGAGWMSAAAWEKEPFRVS